MSGRGLDLTGERVHWIQWARGVLRRYGMPEEQIQKLDDYGLRYRLDAVLWELEALRKDKP